MELFYYRHARRVVFGALVVFVALLLVPWHNVDWGTAPEWIAAGALVAIAIALWRVAASTSARERVRSSH